jgi:hypothetical protein
MATKPFLSQIAVPVGTTTGDVYYPQTSLLMHFNGTNGSTTMTDNSKNNLAVTSVNGAAISTAQSKFGGASALFDGTNDYLSIADTESLRLGSVAYTIEAWIYLNSLPSNGVAWSIFQQNQHIGGGNFLEFVVWNNSGTYYLEANLYNSSVYKYTVNKTVTNLLNVWHHVALIWTGTTAYVSFDGVLSAGVSYSGNDAPSTPTSYIGLYYASTSYYFNGYIDELRITKGIARYTSNFTPSTTQFLDSTGDANSNVVVNSTATGFAIGTGGINGAQLAKAWVNFNGAGTVSITDSYNVSSITDLGTGQYLVNYSTARSNANYVHFISMPGNSDSPSNSFTTNTANNSYSQTTTYAVVTTRFNGSLYDAVGIHSIVFSN